MSNDGLDPYKKLDTAGNPAPKNAQGQGDSTDRTFKLDSVLKTQFERAFGVDLSDVRIHTGPLSDMMTGKAQADAVTIGSDIYFHTGKYAPDTEEGAALLAHELQHFVHFQNDKRMVYKEDIEEIEKEADMTEVMMAKMNLHNVKGPVLEGEDTVSIDTSGDEDEYVQNDTKEEITDPSLGFKESGFKGGKPLYRIYFPSTGKAYTISHLARERAITRTLQKYRDYIDREAALLPENEREQFVINHMLFLMQL
jgi:hypothetical protein